MMWFTQVSPYPKSLPSDVGLIGGIMPLTQVTWLTQGIYPEQKGNFLKCFNLIFIEHLLYARYYQGTGASE